MLVDVASVGLRSSKAERGPLIVHLGDFFGGRLTRGRMRTERERLERLLQIFAAIDHRQSAPPLGALSLFSPVGGLRFDGAAYQGRGLPGFRRPNLAAPAFNNTSVRAGS